MRTKTNDYAANGGGRKPTMYEVRKARVAKYAVGHKFVTQKVGADFGGEKSVRSVVYRYGGDEGTVAELARKYGCSYFAVINRMAAGKPISQPPPPPMRFSHGGRMMTVSEIVKDISGEIKGRGLLEQTVRNRIRRCSKGCLEPVRKIYSYVDFDGKVKRSSVNDLCRYYANYHGEEFSKRIFSRVRGRMFRNGISVDKTFDIRKLLDDGDYAHRRGMRN